MIYSEKIIETKICGECKSSFDVTDKDMKFYDKVSPVFAGEKFKIPTPTFCPDCRQQRRQLFKNIYHLYKNEQNLLVSHISPDKKLNVISQEEWWKDANLGLEFGREYDSSTSFFKQFKMLQKVAPRWNLIQIGCENCEWCINISNSNNCYYVKSGGNSEDCLYGERVYNSRNSLDCVRVNNVTSCYSSYNITDCYEVFFGGNISNGKNSMYVTDSKNINNCIGCIGLDNKKNYILNVPSSKEEVEDIKIKLLKDKKFRKSFFISYNELVSKFPVKSTIINDSEKSFGNEISNSKDTYYGFDVTDVESGRYVFDGIRSKDIMDVNGYDNGQLSYECCSDIELYKSSFCFNSGMLNNCFYCETSINLKYCFGCVGIHDKSYCILNKQYTKEEYNILVPKIIERMVIEGEWGEFFPKNMSPYGYNESEANEYFPLSRNEIIKQNFNWSDYEPPFPKVEKIIPANKLPDDISIIPDDILNRAIECKITKKPFRIIKDELAFYRKYNLPIPRKHPDQRRFDGNILKNKRKLYNSKCEKCGTDIKSIYSLDIKKVVYCEKCYSKEVY
ncbi:MAG: hypothetical protein QM490_04870 [Candidatus Gracilibacteria bacterium]